MKLDDSYNRLFQHKRWNITWVKYVELFIFSITPFFIGLWLQPEDPFFLENDFPWLLIPPIFLGIRYGLLYGLLSVMNILLVFLMAWRFEMPFITELPTEMLLGMLILTLAAGETASKALNRINRDQARVAYLNMRIEEFTKSYHILQVSHDQMEEHLAGAKMSLREALQVIRDDLQKNNKIHQGLNRETAEIITSIFSQFTWLNIAGLYKINERQQLQQTPLSTIGKMPAVYKDDVLIQEALKTGDLVSIRPNMYIKGIQKNINTNLLAIIPLTDVSGHIWGIIAISEMNLLAFQNENLNLMELLGGYIGDVLSHADSTLLNDKGKHIFIKELQTAMRIANEHGVQSILSVVTFRHNKEGKSYADAVASRIRGLDHAWELQNRNGEMVVFLLMPLMLINDFYRYQESLDHYFQERFGLTVDEAGLEFHSKEIKRDRRRKEYVRFLSRVSHVEQKYLVI